MRADARCRLMCLIACVLFSPRVHRLDAQSGTITGTVYRDTLDNGLAQVEVTIGALNRRVVTNYRGEFRLANLPAGRYAVAFRHVGFEELIDSIVVPANG